MKLRSRSFAYVVGIGVIVLAIVMVLLLNLNDEQEPAYVAPSASAVPSKSSDPTEPDAAQEWAPSYAPFATDSKQATVLWQSGQSRIYVQDNRLQYVNADGYEQTLHNWREYPDGLTAQAWLNGPYLLIGTQLLAQDTTEDGMRGEWLAFRVEPNFELVQEKEMPFGPEEVMSVTVAENPQIFLLRLSDQDYLFDPGLSAERWMRVEVSSLDPGITPALKAPSKSDGLRSFNEERQCCLVDGSGVNVFSDEAGIIVYRPKPYPIAARYVDLELIDIKQIPVLDQDRKLNPHVLGWFRNEAGVETMAFVNHDYFRFPAEQRLFETGWQALDYYTFTRMTPEKLEVFRFKDRNTGIGTAEPYRELPIQTGQQVSAKGRQLFIEKDGSIQSLSWFDLANADAIDPPTLLASPLDDYVVKEEPKPEEFYHTLKGRILEGSFEGSFEENTNAEVSNELRNALQEKYADGDYGWSKTFRNFGSRWYVIADRKLAEYKDGKMAEIGELPITVSIEIGEGAGGHGARDFMRMDDGGWIVADTEASRVIRLNDKLEIESEIEVPTPYRLTRDGDRIRIDSTAQQWITDMELHLLDQESQPFDDIVPEKMSEHDFWPQGWYEDPDTGLIWYTFNGLLYQVDEKRKKYRLMYIGNNENALAYIRILPHEDEVRVLLDRKLERFDRQGNWIGTLAFPRVEPDGIYDLTPQGENSLILDEASDVMYLVQGFRVIRIDVKHGETKTIFRQNYSDIGKLAAHNGKLYFIVRGDLEDRYRHAMHRGSLSQMYTEIIEIDRKTLGVRRSFVEGYYDELEVGTHGFVLTKYNP